ncbi:hypothetical protein [Amycolatopsis decaplanina]|uniref:Nitroreductase n=1 Tax=Amycolatopsis decaplanina DSM 44594 TaxID=1284240 RepID=M2YK85_9PSEU|nr:nitroreductase [Amycolatopsis decaplanina DSM 44594]
MGRNLGQAVQRPLADTDAQDGAALTVLSTADDTPLSRLQAGEAASAVLVTATRLNLASCLVTEPLEEILRPLGHYGIGLPVPVPPRGR